MGIIFNKGCIENCKYIYDLEKENEIKIIDNINVNKEINEDKGNLVEVKNKYIKKMSENDISEINIIYDINGKKNVNIFGTEFVENNKNICKMIIDNKEYELSENYNVKRNSNILKIKLKEINNVINMSFMFYRCSSLSSSPDISKWNTNNVTNMTCMLYGCNSLIYN